MPIYPCPWKTGQRPAGVNPLRLVVCGTRTYEDYDKLERVLDRLTFWHPVTDVWIGGFGTRIERGGEWVWVGADALANRWATKRWHLRKLVHADWTKYKTNAGPIRNTDMAKQVAAELEIHGGKSLLVAFWDGESPGTKDMIAKYKKYVPAGAVKIVRH